MAAIRIEEMTLMLAVLLWWAALTAVALCALGPSGVWIPGWITAAAPERQPPDLDDEPGR